MVRYSMFFGAYKWSLPIQGLIAQTHVNFTFLILLCVLLYIFSSLFTSISIRKQCSQEIKHGKASRFTGVDARQ
jgi:thiosulfate reductase cytochrome b subunit